MIKKQGKSTTKSEKQTPKITIEKSAQPKDTASKPQVIAINKETPITQKMNVAPKANKGATSLIFFYYGDSEYTTLAQETLKLKKAMEG